MYCRPVTSETSSANVDLPVPGVPVIRTFGFVLKAKVLF